MRVLNAEQMREADRFTVEAIGIPSPVPIATAARQVVAAIAAAFDAVLNCRGASITVTLATPKLPLVLPPGEEHAGDVVIADIGIPHEVIEGVEGRHIELLTPEQLRDVVEPRAADSHKGDFGRVTIVAGSRGKTGAAYLAAMSALRSGAGLVTVATPSSSLPIIASMAPEMMTEPLAE